MSIYVHTYIYKIYRLLPLLFCSLTSCQFYVICSCIYWATAQQSEEQQSDNVSSTVLTEETAGSGQKVKANIRNTCRLHFTYLIWHWSWRGRKKGGVRSEWVRDTQGCELLPSCECTLWNPLLNWIHWNVWCENIRLTHGWSGKLCLWVQMIRKHRGRWLQNEFCSSIMMYVR